MDHLFLAHGIAKDAKHPTILSKQAKEAREQCKKRALDAGMSEARFQAICTTRSNATTELAMYAARQGNHQGRDTAQPLFIASALLPPFWINAEYLLQNAGAPANCVAGSHPV